MSDEAIASAQQCIVVARTAYASGDITKAIRFCQKSLNFHHSTVAETLLQQYQQEHNNGTTTTKTSTTTTSTTTIRRGSASKPAGATPQEETKRVYTEEQALAARAIKKLKNYYEVLGLTRDSTDKDIKAAYRKRALQFHPDKNQAPEAEEAFKAVSTAFQTLSDPQKRAYYDEHGEDEQTSRARQHSQHAQYEREQDLTPEDIFNMFFNVRPGAQGGYARRTYVYPRQQRRRTADEQQQPASSLMQFVQFLPLLLLLVFSFLSAPGGEELPFSLDPTPSFTIGRTTRHTDIQYYVNRNFASRYRDPRALAQVEVQVEQQMFKKMEDECQRQKLEKKNAIAAAKQATGGDLNEKLQHAQSMQTPACTRLQQMHPAHRQGG